MTTRLKKKHRTKTRLLQIAEKRVRHARLKDGLQGNLSYKITEFTEDSANRSSPTRGRTPSTIMRDPGESEPGPLGAIPFHLHSSPILVRTLGCFHTPRGALPWAFRKHKMLKWRPQWICNTVGFQFHQTRTISHRNWNDIVYLLMCFKITWTLHWLMAKPHTKHDPLMARWRPVQLLTWSSLTEITCFQLPSQRVVFAGGVQDWPGDHFTTYDKGLLWKMH